MVLSPGVGAGVLGYVGSDLFWGFKILIFNNFAGFKNNKYFFFGYEDFVPIFWGKQWMLGPSLRMEKK